MRVILNTFIDNDELPFIEPAMQLIRPSSLAIYDMQSRQDFTGNAVMDFSGSFNAQGAVLASVNDFINTKINESDEMTLIYCWNLVARAGQRFSSLSNITPSSAPYSGIRLATDTTGVTTWSAATGLASPSVTMMSNVNILGAWTVQTLTVSNTQIRRITHGGSVTQATISAREKSTYPIFLNAVPSIPTGITEGTTGTIGFFCAYNAILADTDVISSMDIIASIMAARGVAVP
ncbi:TPA: hypothetical protein NPM97_004048 [Klebsiella pneumoniae]|uniref:hypothetical protein n=1 Tax=Klebsiella pneumoniae TaxID=573 RepID=UPI0029366F0F|nr:hypothetical protein [Klebsiella pneumoniae]MDV2890034.1 hypothetical protein [Klebsiella pneumoniae]HCI5260236.1 hypothetical protein [Klebsiella pneumoniae]